MRNEVSVFIYYIDNAVIIAEFV